MLPIKPAIPADQQELLDNYKKLPEADRHALLTYSAFLVANNPEKEIQEEVTQFPLQIERPENETVVKAMRRLSETYPMIDKSVLLDEASSLMSRHILHGEPAENVIDELERLFADTYAEMPKL